MAQMLAGPWNESRLVSEMASLQTMLQPQATLMPEAVLAASDRARTFIAGRRAEVEADLVAPGPAWPPDPPAASATPVPLLLTGSFEAPWSATAPTDPVSTGTATLNVEIAGKPRPAFERGAAYSVTNGQLGPASGRERYKNVTITGRAGSQTWTLMLTIDLFLIESAP